MRGFPAPDKLPGCESQRTREPGVLPELMRALPVAVLAGVAPGYFWARCLAPSTGWAGRIAYATALSMALVPTTALLLARILGTGVTLFIGASSVLAVFAAGFAAYLRFGKARYDDKPLFYPPPAPQGVYALAPLLAAFGLALGMALGLIPATLVALLVVLSLLMVAAVASLVAAGDAGPAPGDATHCARTGLPRSRAPRLALHPGGRSILPRRDDEPDANGRYYGVVPDLPPRLPRAGRGCLTF